MRLPSAPQSPASSTVPSPSQDEHGTHFSPSPYRTTRPGDPARRQPEPAPATGVPFQAKADRQTWGGNIWTGIGGVEF